MKCIIDGCEKDKHEKAAKGMCRKHYDKLLRYGDPLYKPERKPIENPKYSTIHKRLFSIKGPAAQYNCAHCDSTAHEWACIDNKTEHEIVNNWPVSYSKSIEDYIPLCRHCHRIWDRRPRSEKCIRGHNNWYYYVSKNKRYCKDCANERRRKEAV